MKYRVENQLDLFVFHDSEFSLISFDKKDLVVSVKHLNIHEDAKENPHDCDMEISTATISFQNVRILSFEHIRGYVVDDEGNRHPDEPQITYKGNDAEEKFIGELQNGFSLNGIVFEQCGRYTIKIETNAPKCFWATFSFSDVIVEWDEYCKKAWYEYHKQYNYEITLLTPDGEQTITY